MTVRFHNGSIVGKQRAERLVVGFFQHIRMKALGCLNALVQRTIDAFIEDAVHFANGVVDRNGGHNSVVFIQCVEATCECFVRNKRTHCVVNCNVINVGRDGFNAVLHAVKAFFSASNDGVFRNIFKLKAQVLPERNIVVMHNHNHFEIPIEGKEISKGMNENGRVVECEELLRKGASHAGSGASCDKNDCLFFRVHCAGINLLERMNK